MKGTANVAKLRTQIQLMKLNKRGRTIMEYNIDLTNSVTPSNIITSVL